MTTIRLIGPAQVNRACEVIRSAPLGHIVTVREPTRNLEQNAKLHAMIDDIQRADPIGGGYDHDDWKIILVHGWKGELRLLKGIDGALVPVGRRTSKLTMSQFADLIEYIYAKGAEWGIEWSEPRGMA